MPAAVRGVIFGGTALAGGAGTAGGAIASGGGLTTAPRILIEAKHGANGATLGMGPVGFAFFNSLMDLFMALAACPAAAAYRSLP